MIYRNIFYAIILLTCWSCATNSTRSIANNIFTLKDSYCKASVRYNYDKNSLPSYNSDSIILSNTHLKEDFNDQSILILNAIGGINQINEIINLKQDSSLVAQLKILQLKNNINSKISIALNELDAVAAEYDCEGERVTQMADFVDQINDNNNNKHIIYSIAAGALASIAGGIVKSDGWGSAIDIAGGVVGAGFGFLTLKPKGKKVEFVHKRNLLDDVWKEQLLSENFPPFVWYMFTEKKFSGQDNQSIIQFVKGRWLQYHFNGNKEEADRSVMFGEGGYYLSDDLHNRSAMLNQMQSITNKFNQNINYLLLDLDKFVMD